jgi:hypothetical protein
MAKRFHLHRDVDESGVSGTGLVAEGVLFQSGKVVISWLTRHTSLGTYDSIEGMLNVHGHGGKTRLVWVDADSTANTMPAPPPALEDVT